MRYAPLTRVRATAPSRAPPCVCVALTGACSATPSLLRKAVATNGWPDALRLRSILQWSNHWVYDWLIHVHDIVLLSDLFTPRHFLSIEYYMYYYNSSIIHDVYDSYQVRTMSCIVVDLIEVPFWEDSIDYDFVWSLAPYLKQRSQMSKTLKSGVILRGCL